MLVNHMVLFTPGIPICLPKVLSQAILYIFSLHMCTFTCGSSLIYFQSTHMYTHMYTHRYYHGSYICLLLVNPMVCIPPGMPLCLPQDLYEGGGRGKYGMVTPGVHIGLHICSVYTMCTFTCGSSIIYNQYT